MMGDIIKYKRKKIYREKINQKQMKGKLNKWITNYYFFKKSCVHQSIIVIQGEREAICISLSFLSFNQHLHLEPLKQVICLYLNNLVLD